MGRRPAKIKTETKVEIMKGKTERTAERITGGVMRRGRKREWRRDGITQPTNFFQSFLLIQGYVFKANVTSLL